MSTEIVVVEYDPGWVELFEQLAEPVRSALEDLGVDVQHVGSTSVPGLAAKPVIDIDVVLRSKADVGRAVERLSSIGYTHQGDLGIPGREAFIWPDGLPRHHLYTVVAGNQAHLDHVNFRDYLRTDPRTARRYGQLKARLAIQYREDRAGYTEAKTAFISDVLATARRRSTCVAQEQHLDGALAVWRSANIARGLPPSPARTQRVAEKLSSPDAVVVVHCETDTVSGMVLAEPFRDRDGLGQVVPSAGHLSMVFVLPERWGAGIGGQLMDELHRQMRVRGWSRSSVWTRANNSRARGLYASRGYRLTNETKQLESGDQVVRYQLDLPGAPGV